MIIPFKGYDDNGGLHTNHMNENQPNRAYFHRFGYRIDYSLAKSAKFNTIWLKNSLFYSQINENTCDLADFHPCGLYVIHHYHRIL